MHSVASGKSPTSVSLNSASPLNVILFIPPTHAHLGAGWPRLCLARAERQPRPVRAHVRLQKEREDESGGGKKVKLAARRSRAQLRARHRTQYLARRGSPSHPVSLLYVPFVTRANACSTLSSPHTSPRRSLARHRTQLRDLPSLSQTRSRRHRRTLILRKP